MTSQAAHVLEQSLPESDTNTNNNIVPLPGVESSTSPSCETQPRDTFKCTDMGNAKRFVHHHGEKVRYVDDLKSWFIYQDKYWQKDNTKKIVLLAKNTVQRISDEAEALEESDPQKCEEIKKHATNSQARGRIKSMIELVEPELPITPNEFDTHPYLLTVQNGTIDLRDGKLRPHDPKHFITHYLDIPFDETAKCPSWLRFFGPYYGGQSSTDCLFATGTWILSDR
jgi:putative DNA primase/helicase